MNLNNFDISSVGQLPAVPLRKRNFLPEISAVYFLTIDIDQLRILYIGRTNNLKRRWRGHDHLHVAQSLATIGFNPLIAYWDLDIPGNEINRIEQTLIKRFNPPLNQGRRIDFWGVKAKICFNPNGESLPFEFNIVEVWEDIEKIRIKQESLQEIVRPISRMTLPELRLLAEDFCPQDQIYDCNDHQSMINVILTGLNKFYLEENPAPGDYASKMHNLSYCWERPYLDLYLAAFDLGVYGYARMTRDELKEVIHEISENQKEY